MRKFMLVPLAAAVLAILAVPASANQFTPLTVSCTHVAGGWAEFPDTDQTITVHVTQPGSADANLTVHTGGKQSGTFDLPLGLTGNGLITATVTASVVEDGPKSTTATADCRPATTTTTSTTTTTRPPVTTTRPPATIVPPVSVVRPPPTIVVLPPRFLTG